MDTPNSEHFCAPWRGAVCTRGMLKALESHYVAAERRSTPSNNNTQRTPLAFSSRTMLCYCRAGEGLCHDEPIQVRAATIHGCQRSLQSAACGAKWLHWRSVAAALVAALYNHEVTATPRQYQISTRLWGRCQAATRYLCEASNWKQRSRCCCSVSPSSTVPNNYTEWLASRCMARHTRSSAVADVRFSLFECYCFPSSICLSTMFQGLKKGVFRVQPDDYGWQQDEYKLQNGKRTRCSLFRPY